MKKKSQSFRRVSFRITRSMMNIIQGHQYLWEGIDTAAEGRRSKD